MALKNVGDNVPALGTNDVRSAIDDVARTTVTAYVVVDAPSAAVTTVLITLVPTFRLIAPLAAPEATVVPLIFTVAPLPDTVGVSVILVVALGTLSV